MKNMTYITMAMSTGNGILHAVEFVLLIRSKLSHGIFFFLILASHLHQEYTVAFYYVTMKLNSRKNNVCCEHTRGAP